MPPTMRLHSGLLAIAVLAALVPKSVEASPLIFTDRATFLNVHTALGLPPLALETFEAPVWDNNISSDSCVLNVPGLRIGHDCHDGAVDISGPSGFAAFPQDRFSVIARFDLPQTSIGFDYNVPSHVRCLEFPFDPADVSCNVVNFGAGLSFFLSGSGFLGIIDTSNPIIGMGTPHPSPIASGYLQMDNLLYRVPEPSTALLFGSAFALLQVVRLRRKNRSVFRSLN